MSAPALYYPDLDPPAGWPIFRVGTQMRLVPPGTELQTAGAALVVSPIVARHERLPPIDRLIEYAIAAEARARLEIMSQSGPTPFTTTSGMPGVSYELTGYGRPAQPVEKRIYVMVSDAACYYGINYLASEAAYPEFVDVFWEVARSMRSFRGRVQPPPSEGEPGKGPFTGYGE